MLGYQITNLAIKNGLDPLILAGIIAVESGGYRHAIRYESGFYERYCTEEKQPQLIGYVPPSRICSEETERRLRAFSYGLFQVMGQTARENGYQGYLTNLIDKPEDNIIIGVKIFKRFYQENNQDLQKTLLRWNGGEDPAYPQRVYDAIDNGSASKILQMENYW